MLKPLLKLVSCRKRSNVVSEKKDTINQEKKVFKRVHRTVDCRKRHVKNLINGYLVA